LRGAVTNPCVGDRATVPHALELAPERRVSYRQARGGGRRKGNMVAALISVVAFAAMSLAAEPRLLVRSGTLVSGEGLTRFRDPAPSGDGGLLFRGTTEVVTLPDDAGGVRTILTSGTPAPDLAGETINSFLDVRSTPDDGFVAVLADLNGTTAD